MVKPFFLVLVCLVVVVHAQDQSGFISIDCGLADNSTYTDGKTGIRYVSDAEFLNTENGVSKTISTLYQTNDLDQQFVHVRSFPRGIKNCYTLKPPRLLNRNRYFVRARFLYGSYDNKNQLPIFDLYFGVDYWDTIQFVDGHTPINREILHVPSNSSAYTYVCLVNTDLGTPFISALEVRLVDDYIYPVDSGSLQLYNRYDFKAYSNQQIIRYKDDVFDRIWKPSFFEFNVTEVKTPTNTTAIVNNDYKLPLIVLQTAIAPLNSSEPIEFYWKPPDPLAGYFLYFHFADFQSNLTRQFNISVGDAPWHTNFSPDFLYATTVYNYPKPEAGASWVNFSLTRTSKSDLPPIFNAFEIYTAREFSYLLTSQEDINAIKSIKAYYGLKKDWQGDPCLPTNYTWESIGCYTDTPFDDPRIISLNLSSNELTGKISLLISDLEMLQTLDLSNNNLTGGVPDFLADLKLKVLILSRNNLSGTLPPKLIERNENGLLKLSVEGNPNLCGSGSCVGSPSSTTPPPTSATNNNKGKMLFLIIGAVVGVFVILAVLVTVWILIVVKKRKLPSQPVTVPRESFEVAPASTVGNSSKSGVGPFRMAQQQFSYSDVVRITANFQRELGKGGFGAVYHGYLDEIQVAVKMLSSTSNQGYKQFKAEAELLTRVHHRNLTTLVGYCDEGDKQGLIYEYMPKSDLRSHLSERSVDILSWAKRLSIVVDAAQGLEYLHTGCKPPIIHRDIKSTNILLNDEFQAKLADFGLSKVFPMEGATHMSTGIAGTPGYLDPEYNINEKSDVFSFGIVLMEIITGKPPISKFPERVHLYKWVDHMITTSGDIRNVADPKLCKEFDVNSMWKAIDLALECVSSTRPTMNHVVIELKSCFDMENARFKNGRESSLYDSIEVSSLNIDTTGIHPLAR